MRLTLRAKLLSGFAGVALILAVVGIHSLVQINELDRAVDVILAQNLPSVLACQDMNEALERLDSGALLTMLGNGDQGRAQVAENATAFEQALKLELTDRRLVGEAELADEIDLYYSKYLALLQLVCDPDTPLPSRRDTYFGQMQPLFTQIKQATAAILKLNQDNMAQANAIAKRRASAARNQMYLLLAAAVLMAGGFVFFTQRWVLLPLQRLIASTHDIQRGNLELVLPIHSHDEVGQLSASFNAMAASLREIRRSDRAKLLLVERYLQQAFRSLPEAVAVVNAEGVVQVASELAREAFGLRPEVDLQSLNHTWLAALFTECVSKARPVEGHDDARVVQQFWRGEERFFQPSALPVLAGEGEVVAGVILLLRDVTQVRQHDEMKRGMIATVSHQLKTPLTSIRMALHLLLEERAGTLTPKQQELASLARDDSERLQSIIEDLLDLSRLQAGRAQLDGAAVRPDRLVATALDEYRGRAQDRRLTLTAQVPPGLPEVWADAARIKHVFANLLANAIKYTRPGGQVRVEVQALGELVEFSVRDTGRGIPAQYVGRVFDQFFRVPGSRHDDHGAGLGLSIAKEIVDAHGGSIRAESQEGHGSRFIFTLRRADRVAAEAATPSVRG